MDKFAVFIFTGLQGFTGSFSTVKGGVQRGWICEKESGIDQNQIKETILALS